MTSPSSRKSPLALTELYTLMLQRLLTPEVFVQWVHKSYGEPAAQGSDALVLWVAQHCEPQPIDGLRVHAFDKYLLKSGMRDPEFTRTIVALRNVFARNAKMPQLALGLPRSVLAEAVERLAARYRVEQQCQKSFPE